MLSDPMTSTRCALLGKWPVRRRRQARPHQRVAGRAPQCLRSDQLSADLCLRASCCHASAGSDLQPCSIPRNRRRPQTRNTRLHHLFLRPPWVRRRVCEHRHGRLSGTKNCPMTKQKALQQTPENTAAAGRRRAPTSCLIAARGHRSPHQAKIWNTVSARLTQAAAAHLRSG